MALEEGVVREERGDLDLDLDLGGASDGEEGGGCGGKRGRRKRGAGSGGGEGGGRTGHTGEARVWARAVEGSFDRVTHTSNYPSTGGKVGQR